MSNRLTLLCASVIMAGLVGCGQKTSGELVQVNGEGITLDQFHRFLEAKPTVNVTTGDGQVVQAQVSESLAFQAFQDLMRQRILLQMAKDYNVAPTEKDVLDEIEFQKKRNPNFIKDLQTRGLTLGEIRESLAVDLSRERLLTRGITVTTEETEKFIKDNPRQFVEPATVDMLWLLVKDEAAKGQVDRELNAGQQFSAVAQQFSTFPGARQSPRFPQRAQAALPPVIRNAIAKVGDAQQSAWLKLPEGWARFYVERKEAEKPVVMDETKKKALQRELAVRRGLQANDLDKALLEQLKASKIDVKYEDLKDPWKKAEERLKQETDMQAKTATQAGAAPAPAPAPAPK